MRCSCRRLSVERLEGRDLLAAALLETTFGDNGIFEYGIPVETKTVDRLIAAVSDEQGRVVMGGYTTIGHGRVAVLVRYAQDGSLDDTFDEDGIAFFPLTGEYGAVRDLAISPDGSIYLVAGTADYAAVSTLVAKVRDDGTLDPTFGIGGVLDTGGNGKMITLAPNGEFLIAGSNKIERFRANGSRVRDFGDLGTVTTHYNGTYPFAYPEELLVLSDGSLIIAATDAFSSTGTETNLHFLKYAPDGTRDMAFGDHGSLDLNVISTNSPGSDYFQGTPVHLIVTPDERVLVVTRRVERTAAGRQYDFLLTKMKANGELDSSFSGDGELRLHFDGLSSVAGVRVQSDGSIFVGGTIGRSSHNTAVVAKLTSGGAFDPTFGDGGIAESSLDDFQFGLDRDTRNSLVAIPDDGNAIVFTAGDDFRLVAFTVTGGTSTAYGNGAQITTNIANSVTDTSPQFVVELEDGTFLVLAEKQSAYRSDYTLLRVWADGVLDTNYGQAGEYDLTYVRTELLRRTQSARLVKGPDGIFVLFSGSEELTVGGFDKDGNLNRDFGTNGWATLEFPADFIELQDVLVTDEGRLRVFASGSDSGNYIGIGIDEAGTIDTTFAEQGYLRIPNRQYGYTGIAVCGTSTGRVTVVFASPDDGSDAEVVVERFDAYGRKDVSFGNNGRAIVPLSRSDEYRQIVCQPDQGVVIAGAYRESVYEYPHARIIRFSSTGQIDTSFGSNGVVDVRTTNTFDLPKTIHLDSKGRIIVGLQSRADSVDFSVIRLNADGSRDSTLGTNGSIQLDVHGYGDYLASALLVQNEDIIVTGSTQTTSDTNLVLTRIVGDRDGHPAWQNPTLASDVNDDGTIAPVDALIVINELNAIGPRTLPQYRIARISASFLDVNGDGVVAPVDALIVVNRLNEPLGLVGEAEFETKVLVSRRPPNFLAGKEPEREHGTAKVDMNVGGLTHSTGTSSADSRDLGVLRRYRVANPDAVNQLFSDIEIVTELATN